MYKVKQITRADCAEYILGIHYARRWPSISYAFGLFKLDEMVGCVTFGTPCAAPVRTGVAGRDLAPDVLELNRLALRNNERNEASILVGGSLRMLPPRKFILSFADTAQGHNGCVYRATNFKYYGLSAKRTDWRVKGKEHLHGQSIADEFRGFPNRAEKMREKYGDDFYLAPRSRKHRYIYVTGTARDRRDLEKLIKYTQQPFTNLQPDGFPEKLV